MDGEGLLYEEEGAVWLRTTEYGDDKDRVLIRQTGASHLLPLATSPTTATRSTAASST